MTSIQSLFDTWRGQPDAVHRDQLVAFALHYDNSDHLPHYSTDMKASLSAMSEAWGVMEEHAPAQVICSSDHSGCRVEWWMDEGDHLITPTFSSEAESRAFAAFAFASIEADPS
ncbi:MAG: hypothetical protein HQL54_03185 [Magnetococcales bacterium]|nr:hypothetical protein [Magnetococcales bacterium]